MKNRFVMCDTCLQDKDNNFQNIILTATHWTKMCGPPLMANWVIAVLPAIMWKWSECRVMHDVRIKEPLHIFRSCHNSGGYSSDSHSWGPMFAPRAAHVGYMMKKATLGQILLETLQFRPVHFIPQMLHIHSRTIHKNDNGSTIGCSSTQPSSALFKNSLLLLTANMSVWTSYQTQTQNLFLQAVTTNKQALHLHQPGRVG